jgi:hypothetical protein
MKIFGFGSDHQSETTGSEKKCMCAGKEGLFLEKTVLNRLFAVAIVCALFIFVAGYFWGKKTATDQLITAIEKDSFADQIYYSMCSIYDQKDDDGAEPDVVSGEEEGEGTDAQENGSAVSAPEEKESSTVTPAAAAPKPKIAQKPTKRYQANLAGFGSQQAAQQFVATLSKNNIKTKICKRSSKTARGRAVNWYQVVSDEYTDKVAFTQMVKNAKRCGKLRDVGVVVLS